MTEDEKDTILALVAQQRHMLVVVQEQQKTIDFLSTHLARATGLLSSLTDEVGRLRERVATLEGPTQ